MSLITTKKSDLGEGRKAFFKTMKDTLIFDGYKNGIKGKEIVKNVVFLGCFEGKVLYYQFKQKELAKYRRFVLQNFDSYDILCKIDSKNVGFSEIFISIYGNCFDKINTVLS
jgi:hypothetical protein